MAKRPILLIALSLFAAGSALAQEELSDDRQVQERETQAQTMSEPVYKRLSAVHELMGEGQNAEALKSAQAIEGRRLNEYERAVVYQTIGFIHANENKIRLAIEYFEKSLALNALSPEAQQGMLYSLASLYAAEEQFRKAIETAREWFKYEADPKAEAYMLIGSSFAQLEEYANALPYVQKAIAKSDKPQESWYQLELAVYFEERQIAKAVPLLEKMIDYWPDKKTYWETLSGAHMELGNDRKALSTMMVAYRKGLITEEKKLLNLVKLNMFLEIPYTAGEILASEMAKGRIVKNKETLELLSSAWTSAYEYNSALGIMAELGDLTKDPKYAIESAKLYNELGRWQDVIESATLALERNYEKPGEANLLIGTAYSELDQLGNALRAFERAADVGDQDQRRNARSWIAFVQDRMKVAASRANAAG